MAHGRWGRAAGMIEGGSRPTRRCGLTGPAPARVNLGYGEPAPQLNVRYVGQELTDAC